MRIKKLLSLGLLALTALHASAAIVDGVRQKPDPKFMDFATRSEVYLYNTGAQAFFTQGDAWATKGIVGQDPRKIVFEDQSEGKYIFYCYCWRNADQQGGYMAANWRAVFFDSETAIFVDRNSQPNYFWDVEINTDGTFRILPSSANPTITPEKYPGMYLGLDVTGNAANTVLSPLLKPGTGHYVDWTMVSQDDFPAYEEALKVYDKAQELKKYIDLIKAIGNDASNLEAVYLNEDATSEDIESAIQSALTVYAQALIDEAENRDSVDVTILLKNPDFEQSGIHERNTYGWVTEAVSGGNVRTGGTDANKCFEAWGNSSFDIYQTVTAAPLGVYEIEVHGFYRYSGGDAALEAYYASLESGTPIEVPVYVYMNNNATPLQNVFDEKVRQGDLYTDDTSLLDTAAPYPPIVDKYGYWYPNDMNNCATAFNSGLYAQSAYGLVARDGDILRLGVKGSSNQGGGSWPIWDNFKLIYRGFKPEVVQPVLELAIEECSSLKNYLMGKTEYAALTKAFTDAAAAIAANDGEGMFNALNALYDAKDPALVSKDIFLEQEVAADTLRLAEAIRSMEGKKLSKATLANANALLDGIIGNALYENDEIDRLKSDVSDMIWRLDNSVELYAGLNTLTEQFESAIAYAKEQGASLKLVNQADSLMNIARTGYVEGSLEDETIPSLEEEIYSIMEELYISVNGYNEIDQLLSDLENAINDAEAAGLGGSGGGGSGGSGGGGAGGSGGGGAGGSGGGGGSGGSGGGGEGGSGGGEGSGNQALDDAKKALDSIKDAIDKGEVDNEDLEKTKELLKNLTDQLEKETEQFTTNIATTFSPVINKTPIFNIKGMKANANHKGIVLINGKKILVK